ncbi:MAG: GGDEF domain-containing protein [Vicinamibacterales bacterium]
MYPVQLALLGTELLVLALLVFGLFRSRAWTGRSPLYVVLGGLTYLGAAMPLRVEVAPGWALQPAAVVVFAALLAAVLLVYVADGASQTRRLVIALALGNAGLTLLALIVSQHLRIPGSEVPVTLSSGVLLGEALLALGRATALYFLLIGLILLYEFVSRYLPVLFLRMLVSLGALSTVQVVVFTLVGQWDRPDLDRLLKAGVGGTLLASACYAALLWAYMRYVEPAPASVTGTGDVSDVLHELTYRQLYEQARSRLTRDALTGVRNRGYFDEAFPAAVAHATRYQEHLSVVVADADHFKLVNDRHSHLVGDEVLKRFAGTLVEVARSCDTVCRYGGDEFVVILPNASLASAEAFAQRFQRRLRDQTIVTEHGRAVIQLSATVGVASLLEDVAVRSPEDLLRLADNRLYVGKRAGRDRVIWQDLPVSSVQ